MKNLIIAAFLFLFVIAVHCLATDACYIMQVKFVGACGYAQNVGTGETSSGTNYLFTNTVSLGASCLEKPPVPTAEFLLETENCPGGCDHPVMLEILLACNGNTNTTTYHVYQSDHKEATLQYIYLLNCTSNDCRMGDCRIQSLLSCP